MHTAIAGYALVLNPIQLALIPVLVVFVLGVVWWMIRRVIASIDRLGVKLDQQAEKLGNLSERVAVIESKQDNNTRVANKTARKVGVRLPPELERTLGGSQI